MQKPPFCTTKTILLQRKNHPFDEQKGGFCFYECGNRLTKLIEVRCRQTNFANGWLLFNAEFSTLFNCCQTNFANGWLLFPYSIAALLWLILLCASCHLLCKCLCSWRLRDVRRCRNVEHLHWFRVRLPTLLLCHRLWLLLPN